MDDFKINEQAKGANLTTELKTVELVRFLNKYPARDSCSPGRVSREPNVLQTADVFPMPHRANPLLRIPIFNRLSSYPSFM